MLHQDADKFSRRRCNSEEVRRAGPALALLFNLLTFAFSLSRFPTVYLLIETRRFESRPSLTSLLTAKSGQAIQHAAADVSSTATCLDIRLWPFAVPSRGRDETSTSSKDAYTVTTHSRMGSTSGLATRRHAIFLIYWTVTDSHVPMHELSAMLLHLFALDVTAVALLVRANRVERDAKT